MKDIWVDSSFPGILKVPLHFLLVYMVSDEKSAVNVVVFVPLYVICLFSSHCFQDLSFAFLAGFLAVFSIYAQMFGGRGSGIRGEQISCLMFSELLRSLVLCISLVLENSQPLVFKYFFCLVSSFLLLVLQNYIVVTSFRDNPNDSCLLVLILLYSPLLHFTRIGYL